MRAYRTSILLAGAAVIALGASAQAADKKAAPPPSDPRVSVLEQELRDVQTQLAEIRGNQQAATDNGAALSDLKRSTSAQYVDLSNRLGGETATTIDNGRLSVASPDGNFTFALRSLVQFDYGYFGQGKNPANVDLNSGSNFRRAQFGFVGTIWKDWSYNFTYDFGGQGVEKNGYIYYAYLQYDGLGPLHIRGGAMTPFEGVEDSTSVGDLIFLERATSVDIGRNVAGSPGREGIEVFLQGDNYLLSVAYTGKKATDAATFDAQEAVVSRASWLAANDNNFKWLLDGHVSHVFKVADASANTDASNVFSFSNGAELAVDGTKTVSTGNIDANQVTEFGFETVAEYSDLYGQGGWFHYDITRRTALPNPDFSGWYALATYSITGEQRPYNPGTASFRGLIPAHPLGTPGGWGALELAARYSTIDLDYQPFLATASGGVAGGVQNIWTVGLNWYPVNGIKFQFNYDNIQVSHVNAPTTDISANAIGVRAQISL